MHSRGWEVAMRIEVKLFLRYVRNVTYGPSQAQSVCMDCDCKLRTI